MGKVTHINGQNRLLPTPTALRRIADSVGQEPTEADTAIVITGTRGTNDMTVWAVGPGSDDDNHVIGLAARALRLLSDVEG